MFQVLFLYLLRPLGCTSSRSASTGRREKFWLESKLRPAPEAAQFLPPDRRSAIVCCRSFHGPLKRDSDSAIAYAGWFHACDRVVQTLASTAPASRLFSVRFEPKPFSIDMPMLRFDRALRRPAFEAHEGRGAEGQRDAQRLAISRPSRTSPLSLVTKPQPLVTRLPVRYIARLNRFTSMVNMAAQGVSTAAPRPLRPTNISLFWRFLRLLPRACP